jgi:hypothetical protein
MRLARRHGGAVFIPSRYPGRANGLFLSGFAAGSTRWLMGRTKRPLGARDRRAAKRSVGVPEPALLAALGVLNLGAAFYVRKSAAQGAA